MVTLVVHIHQDDTRL